MPDGEQKGKHRRARRHLSDDCRTYHAQHAARRAEVPPHRERDRLQVLPRQAGRPYARGLPGARLRRARHGQVVSEHREEGQVAAHTGDRVQPHARAARALRIDQLAPRRPGADGREPPCRTRRGVVRIRSRPRQVLVVPGEGEVLRRGAFEGGALMQGLPRREPPGLARLPEAPVRRLRGDGHPRARGS